MCAWDSVISCIDDEAFCGLLGGFEDIDGGDAERLLFNEAAELGGGGGGAKATEPSSGATVEGIWFTAAVAGGATTGRPLPSKGTPKGTAVEIVAGVA